MQKKLSNGLRKKLLRKAKTKMEKKETLFRKYIRKLIEKHPESTIILIGSRAKGKPLPYSDYDVVIIFRKINNKFNLIQQIRKYKPKDFSLDIIVLEENELKDPLIIQMLENGKILHDGLKVVEKLKT